MCAVGCVVVSIFRRSTICDDVHAQPVLLILVYKNVNAVRFRVMDILVLSMILISSAREIVGTRGTKFPYCFPVVRIS